MRFALPSSNVAPIVGPRLVFFYAVVVAVELIQPQFCVFYQQLHHWSALASISPYSISLWPIVYLDLTANQMRLVSLVVLK